MAIANNYENSSSSRLRGKTFIGDANANEIEGGDGNDLIDGREGDDVIDGGLGNDTLRGGDGDDEIIDNSGHNTIYGGAGNDRINGTGVIHGGAGNDVIVAGFGNNQISGGDGNDSITAGEGDDSINGGAGDDRIRAGAGNDVIEDSEGNNDINGGAGDDTIYAAGKMAGGRGNDTLTAANVASGDTYLFNKGDGHDEITDAGNNGTVDTLQFGNGIASAGTQVFKDGNDVVIKLGDADSVRILDWFGPATDGTNNVMEFVRFANGTYWTPEAIQNILDSGPEGSRIIFGDEFDNELHGTEEGDIIHALGGNDTVYAKAGDDKVLAGTGNDTVHGGAGNDDIDGGEGNDILYGEDGNDVIRGGTGRDTIDGGGGNDQIYGAGTMTGGKGDDMIVATDNDSSDTYVFNSGDGRDVIADLGSNSTNDVLKLGAGITLDKVSMVRSGDDAIFSFGTDQQVTVSDWFKLTEGERNRRLESVQFSSGGIWNDTNFQQLLEGGVGTLSGTQLDDQINGNDAHNTIYGNEGRDTIDGGAGNDTVEGGVGDDTIDGGDGDDRLEGGDGNDTLRGGAGNDALIGGNGVDDMDGGDGDDVVQGAGTLAGGRGDDRLIGTNLESGDTYKFNSGDGRDTIIDVGVATSKDKLQFGQGIGKSNVIMVRAGDDLILRVGGNDEVRIQDWFKEGNEGKNHQIEDLIFGDGTKMTADEINKIFESIGGGEGGGDTGVGTAGDDILKGTEGDDILYGMDGNDQIFGYDGNDQLHGGRHNDKLFGGTGDDTLNGDAGDDILDGDAGNDKLYGGAGNDKMNGGAGNDVIHDGDGVNELNGGDGNDVITGAGTFRGGKGNDDLTAVNGESNDTYLYANGDGWDTISEQASGTSNSTEDILRFEDLNSNNLWFVREGNDLKIHHMGTRGGMTIKSWFEGSGKQIENIFTNDGKVLTNDKVAALVQALAGFNPPAGGYDSMSTDQRRRYDAALASYWATQSS